MTFSRQSDSLERRQRLEALTAALDRARAAGADPGLIARGEAEVAGLRAELHRLGVAPEESVASGATHIQAAPVLRPVEKAHVAELEEAAFVPGQQQRSQVPARRWVNVGDASEIDQAMFRHTPLEVLARLAERFDLRLVEGRLQVGEGDQALLPVDREAITAHRRALELMLADVPCADWLAQHRAELERIVARWSGGPGAFSGEAYDTQAPAEAAAGELWRRGDVAGAYAVAAAHLDSATD